MRAEIPFLGLAAALLLAGCGLFPGAGDEYLVGPDYETPEAAAAERWIDFQDSRVRSEETDLGAWWGVFKDPALSKLMGQAREENLTLRAAAERVSASRSRLGVAVGSLYPQDQAAWGYLPRGGNFSSSRLRASGFNPSAPLGAQNPSIR